MFESVNGQMTVTSQQSALPFCQGTRDSPSERDYRSDGKSPDADVISLYRFLDD